MHLAVEQQEAEPNPAIAASLNWVGAVASLWAFFLPTFYQLLITVLAAVPAFAVIVWFQSKGSYEIPGGRSDPRPGLGVAFCFPSLVLCLRTLSDFHLLNSLLPFLCAFAAAIALTLLMAKEEKKRRKPSEFVMLNQTTNKGSIFTITVFIVGASYVFGLLGQSNVLLDRSSPQLYKAQVVGKRESSTVKGGSFFNLTITPWGPQKEITTESVKSWVFNSVQTGQEVCINLSSGALNMPWYVIRTCY
jgi:hypothetical protein